MSLFYKVCLVGCGKMGTALLLGWIKNKDLKLKITVIDPFLNSNLLKKIKKNKNLEFFKSVRELDNKYSPNLIVLAVKPQILSNVIKELESIYSDKTIFLSIAAGIACNKLQEMIRKDSIICRAMPNTPASIGKGITCLLRNKRLSERQFKLIKTILSVSGKIELIEKEIQMDAVTALSGSGPAYIFLIAEILSEVGYNLGLEKSTAKKLSRQTVIGSAYLLESNKMEASKLRENVTSEGGTTFAAIKILNNNDALKKLFFEAMSAAKNRSIELNKK